MSYSPKTNPASTSTTQAAPTQRKKWYLAASDLPPAPDGVVVQLGAVKFKPDNPQYPPRFKRNPDAPAGKWVISIMATNGNLPYDRQYSRYLPFELKPSHRAALLMAFANEHFSDPKAAKAEAYELHNNPNDEDQARQFDQLVRGRLCTLRKGSGNLPSDAESIAAGKRVEVYREWIELVVTGLETLNAAQRQPSGVIESRAQAPQQGVRPPIGSPAWSASSAPQHMRMFNEAKALVPELESAYAPKDDTPAAWILAGTKYRSHAAAITDVLDKTIGEIIRNGGDLEHLLKPHLMGVAAEMMGVATLADEAVAVVPLRDMRLALADYDKTTAGEVAY